MYELSGVGFQPWAWAQARRRALGDPPTADRALAIAPLPMAWPEVDEAAIRAEMERRLVQRGWLGRRVA